MLIRRTASTSDRMRSNLVREYHRSLRARKTCGHDLDAWNGPEYKEKEFARIGNVRRCC